MLLLLLLGLGRAQDRNMKETNTRVERVCNPSTAPSTAPTSDELVNVAKNGSGAKKAYHTTLLKAAMHELESTVKLGRISPPLHELAL